MNSAFKNDELLRDPGAGGRVGAAEALRLRLDEQLPGSARLHDQSSGIQLVCFQNDGFCIQNDGLCIQNVALFTGPARLHGQSAGLPEPIAVHAARARAGAPGSSRPGKSHCDQVSAMMDSNDGFKMTDFAQ